MKTLLRPNDLILDRQPGRAGALLLVLSLLAIPSVRANLITLGSTPNVAIPDNDINGVADSISVSTPILSLSSLTVTLDIAGGYNGDYYAYLRHGATGFAVLLNRVGTPGNGGYGYADSGFNITLQDGAANGNVHQYQNVVNPGGGALTGTWQPDGSSLVGAFGGMDPNGLWTLFVADLSPVSTGTLESWALTINGDSPAVVGVPDGGSTLLLLGAALSGITGLRRWRKA